MSWKFTRIVLYIQSLLVFANKSMFPSRVSLRAYSGRAEKPRHAFQAAEVSLLAGACLTFRAQRVQTLHESAFWTRRPHTCANVINPGSFGPIRVLVYLGEPLLQPYTLRQ